MPNAKNLKVPTSKEARKNGKKGGQASAKARKEKKTMREQCKMLMSMDISDANPKIKSTLKKLGITDDDTQYSAAIVAAMMQKAIQGDVRAADWIVNMCGENHSDLIKVKEMEIELIKLEAALKDDSGEQKPNNSFIDALKGDVPETWKDDDEDD